MAVAAWLLLILLVGSCSWWMMSKKKEKRSLEAAAAAPPPGPGRWSTSSWCSFFFNFIWQLRETAAFLSAHGSGRGFYHFVHTRYLRHGGACFRTALLGRVHVFVSASVPSASDLLAAEPPHLGKRYARTVADLLGAHSILCCSHGQHRLARRALAALFAAPSTAAFAGAFDRLAADLVTRQWTSTYSCGESGRPVVVLDAAMQISFRAICGMLVGKGGRRLDLERLQSDVLTVTQAMLALPLRWVPGSRFRRGLQARKRIMAALREEMAARRRRDQVRPEEDDAGQEKDADFLQALLERSYKKGHHPDALTDEQIGDNILTLIIAGQVTTAAAITWMVKYLSDNRQIQEKLRQIQMQTQLHIRQRPLTLQDLAGMDYAYKVVKESLRMATVVSWFPRVALADCHLAGFLIKKDWIVNVDARSLHYDPAVFHDPTHFDPCRFDEGDDGRRRRRLLVFGAGGRTCLGMNLAKIMMLIFLHRLVTTFRWEMADDDPSLEEWAMFPRLKNGCPIHLTPIHDQDGRGSYVVNAE
ncbi:hypothetical protein ABZP36_030227 [Zizania latifolia]